MTSSCVFYQWRTLHADLQVLMPLWTPAISPADPPGLEKYCYRELRSSSLFGQLSRSEQRIYQREKDGCYFARVTQRFLFLPQTSSLCLPSEHHRKWHAAFAFFYSKYIAAFIPFLPTHRNDPMVVCSMKSWKVLDTALILIDSAVGRVL